MEIFKHILTIGAGFFTLLIGDYIWLGFIVKNFIIKEFKGLITVTNGAIDIKLGAGLLAWITIVTMLYVFVTHTNLANSPATALGYGALFGFFLYAMYDLTNLTFLNNYSLSFTIVDIAWGTFICALVSLVMYFVKNMF